MADKSLSQAMDDDHSSAGSFSIVDDNKNFNGEDYDSLNIEEHVILKLTDQLESSGIHPSLPVIVEIAKVSYRDFSVGIYTDSNEGIRRRFYFDPIVLLDPNTIVNESHEFLRQDYVRFTIQMWNPDIRSKVLERVKSLPDYKNLEIHEDDISVIPFEEVSLDFKPDSIHKSLKLLDQPSSYIRLSENIDFYFLCDLPSTANVMAEGFRRNPEFTLKTWELALKCSGLALGNGAKSLAGGKPPKLHPTFLFTVSVHRFETGIIN